jgi:hypothetical protein
MDGTSKTQFVVCIANEGCEDLELRKLYAVVSNGEADEPGYVRVVDESGEDYLYPSKYFLPVELPEEVAGAVLAV